MIAKDIVADINAFIQQCGGANPDWYVGVSADVEERLFSYHKVSRNFDSWIYRHADTSEIARTVEKAYITMGCDGVLSEPEAGAHLVYAYRKSVNTGP